MNIPAKFQLNRTTNSQPSELISKTGQHLLSLSVLCRISCASKKFSLCSICDYIQNKNPNNWASLQVGLTNPHGLHLNFGSSPHRRETQPNNSPPFPTKWGDSPCQQLSDTSQACPLLRPSYTCQNHYHQYELFQVLTISH